MSLRNRNYLAGDTFLYLRMYSSIVQLLRPHYSQTVTRWYQNEALKSTLLINFRFSPCIFLKSINFYWPTIALNCIKLKG